MKFFIKDFFSKCDQIRRKLRIWWYVLKKSLMENFIFCAVTNFSISKVWSDTAQIGSVVKLLVWSGVQEL